MNKKILIICIALFCLFLISSVLLINYYFQYHDLKKTIESELSNTNKKKDLYERIILQYELMDFKIFAFEKKYAEFAKIVNKAFEEAKKNKLSPYTVLSVIQVESNFDPSAKSSVANGLMQINLAAWKNYFNIDEKRIHDIDYNITLGCKILRHYLEETNGDLSRALYLYNNGYGFHNEKYVPKVKNNMFSKRNK
ncbi:MAG: transglycosylase SLT domain-containing protein [Candidatus Aminicenantes bacterium]|nr:transglycosylase SLT domain-containing protein [Candidatus Aminicenantes bacterium]NIM80800.1 transglycosylase SLT domain-containing protein [Candidatus Aminicenantes bacterium]NIN20183.1 transglycosylase SLT domain-containing protein [Candidatus Aminicenantes bacterium]NIN43962.1 transglycosylase SLT domain-containing protein [Candidatus Aminicenantes bacterium]NIN86771.1 transglycosylase SLT domain-containing protein [Candidatus Aminicenantes bacterium]